jgi:hypothetical protein
MRIESEKSTRTTMTDTPKEAINQENHEGPA